MIAEPAAHVYSRFDQYTNWKKKHPDSTLSREHYLRILLDVNAMFVEHLLRGYVLNLHHRLGTIYIRRFKRATVHKGNPVFRTDWKKTRKLWREQPEKKERNVRIYFTTVTEPYYYRFFWNKGASLIPGKNFYCFMPTQGPNGVARQITRTLEKNPLAHLAFHT